MYTKLDLTLIYRSEIHLGESKVYQYFGNATHNLTVPDALTKAVKVMNYTGL